MKALVVTVLVAQVGASSVQESVNEMCKLMDGIAAAQIENTPEQLPKMYRRYAGLMADKIDCSLDPYNPLLGYDLKDVKKAQCQQAEVDLTKKHRSELKFQFGSMRCIEKIVDSDAKTAAIWVEMSNTGKYKSKFSVRAAMRMSFDNDNKINAYHVIYDTYNILSRGESAVTVAENPLFSTRVSVAMALFGVSSLVAAAFIMRTQRKHNVLLAEEA